MTITKAEVLIEVVAGNLYKLATSVTKALADKEDPQVGPRNSYTQSGLYIRDLISLAAEYKTGTRGLSQCQELGRVAVTIDSHVLI